MLEYAGELDQFGLAARAALCSSPTEMRAYGVFFPPSAAILAHATAVAQLPFTPVYPDIDAQYETDLELDVSALEPQVALPGGVHRAVNLSQAAGKRIDHAFIGSCGSGLYDDLLDAAAVLKGRQIAPNVRLFIAPGSEASVKRMAREGLMQIFVEAGAVLLPAGCGPCNDAVVGPLHSGEVSISTAANNNAGRFGAKDAELYSAARRPSRRRPLPARSPTQEPLATENTEDTEKTRNRTRFPSKAIRDRRQWSIRLGKSFELPFLCSLCSLCYCSEFRS